MLTMLSRRKQSEFRVLVQNLNAYVEELRLMGEFPNAELYLDGNGYLNLMSGPHHKGRNARPCPENILIREPLKHSDGGDW